MVSRTRTVSYRILVILATCVSNCHFVLQTPSSRHPYEFLFYQTSSDLNSRSGCAFSFISKRSRSRAGVSIGFTSLAVLPSTLEGSEHFMISLSRPVLLTAFGGYYVLAWNFTHSFILRGFGVPCYFGVGRHYSVNCGLSAALSAVSR